MAEDYLNGHVGLCNPGLNSFPYWEDWRRRARHLKGRIFPFQASIKKGRAGSFLSWLAMAKQKEIQAMKSEGKRRGNRDGRTFKKEAWKEMQNMFSTKFAFECDKDSMKLYYANLWNRFNSVKNILCHKDFTWDDSTEMVVADDQVWDAYIQAYPNKRRGNRADRTFKKEAWKEMQKMIVD
ncbi:unnamed protein product [Lupinus luteus]|uniref:Myb/SANT-like domain-containing protein n=1 Tax=Lupinus luteus TaxID=3873 RepID=A0AAV1WAU9_LUPLU